MASKRLCPFKGFTPFLQGKVNDPRGTEGVDPSESKQFIGGAGNQQHHRHVHADQVAIGVGDDGGAAELFSRRFFGIDQPEHESNGYQGDDDPWQGGFRLCSGDQVHYRSRREEER